MIVAAACFLLRAEFVFFNRDGLVDRKTILVGWRGVSIEQGDIRIITFDTVQKPARDSAADRHA